MMKARWNTVGHIWVATSFVAAVVGTAGFCMPYWLECHLFDDLYAYFSSFQRCIYPHYNETGSLVISFNCGIYGDLQSVPSIWWQISAILLAIGTAMCLVIASASISSLWIKMTYRKLKARMAGTVQLTAALCLSVGAALHPMGWGNKEVKQCCGSTAAYRMGSCELSWGLYVISAAILLLMICFILSFLAGRV